MQYEDFMSTITTDVSRILQENSINIVESLLSNIPEGHPCLSAEQLQLCRNAVTISVQLSVQTIFDYLDSLGILNCQNLSEYFEPPALKVIQGGLSDKKE